MAELQVSSPLKDFISTYLIPEVCYEYLFVQKRLRHVPCLKILLSKIMSVWMLGELIAPLFQIWTVLRGGSAEGLSLVSSVLDLLSVSAHTAYCIRHGFPIGAFGESVFVLMQLTLLVFLIHYYRGNGIQGVFLLCVYSGFMYVLSCAVVPVAVLVMMRDWSVLITISSRLIQAGCNINSGSTGRLSAPSVFLMFLASVGRTFRSIQESPDSLGSQAAVLSSGCSLLILLQIWIYRAPSVQQEKKKQ
ncbi:mannose-P-dolichol utilization defect 1a [Trichomycterus rosablanca]|uniref:mannose-P-dolichol utilization defect 1a n=1 Tax=Trichomycterus rosablanca TaxID=2290929 RepID=UPI002F353744